MAPKRKPITLGKGTPNTPAPQRNPQGRRPTSTKPSQAGLTRSALKTTSSGITRRPDGRPQSEGRSARQSTSNARVTRGSSGRALGTGSARVTTGAGRTPPRLPGGAGRLTGPALIAYETLKARPTAAGTISANDPKLSRRIAAMQKSGKEWEAQERRARQRNANRGGTSFDDAFKDARRAGVKTFTWRGKKYTTEMK